MNLETTTNRHKRISLQNHGTSFSLPLDFTSAVTCAPTGSMELVFRSLQKSRKVWTSGPVPSVLRLAAVLKRRSCIVCVASRTMRESKFWSLSTELLVGSCNECKGLLTFQSCAQAC